MEMKDKCFFCGMKMHCLNTVGVVHLGCCLECYLIAAASPETNIVKHFKYVKRKLKKKLEKQIHIYEKLDGKDRRIAQLAAKHHLKRINYKDGILELRRRLTPCTLELDSM